MKNNNMKHFEEYLINKQKELFVGMDAEIGYVLRKLRRPKPEGAGKSYGEIAVIANLDQSYLSKIAKGKRRPTKYAWFRIGVAAGYDVQQMHQFMEAAGFAFSMNSLVDTILLFGVEQGMSLDKLSEYMRSFEKLGINQKIMEEVFGKDY